jgi:CheY-like chemotaxis protein
MMQAPQDHPTRHDASLLKTILVVEDDTGIGEFLAQALKGETSYQVLLVSDGFEALKAVRTLTPSLVLLDYLMPHMDGLETASTLRQREELIQVPIILMSAHLPKEARERSDLILLDKPFDLDRLLTTITELLG